MTDAEQKEYDAAYQAEIDKLDAAAAANASTTDADNIDPAPDAKDALKTDPDAAPQSEAETTEARFQRLEAELASTSKALKDTKSWATKSAAEVKRLRKEQEERERAANRPQVLDDNPGLEEAIRHVSGARPAAAPEEAQQTWADTVATALPELDALLEQNPELQTKAKALAQTLGADWDNPIIAIRELGRLQRDHERTVTSTAAQEAARRDFQQKGQKRTAMQVPTGSAARPAPKADAVKEMEDMSDADFKKMRAKVLGYS